MIVITINIKLKMENTIVLSIVTVIAIMEAQTGSFLTFALIRFLIRFTWYTLFIYGQSFIPAT